MSLTLYSNPMSRGRLVRWMLEEIGEPYDVVYLEYGDAMRTPEFLSLNPMGKVPVLVHDGSVITEAAAICTYLAAAFPNAGLGPLQGERADYYRWMFFAAGPIEAATTNKALGVEPDEHQSGMLGYGNFERTYTALLTAIESRDYVCGDRFTAADVYFGAEVMFGLQFESLPSHDALQAYRARLMERPAWQRAAALDDAALAAKG